MIQHDLQVRGNGQLHHLDLQSEWVFQYLGLPVLLCLLCFVFTLYSLCFCFLFKFALLHWNAMLPISNCFANAGGTGREDGLPQGHHEGPAGVRWGAA